MEEYTELLNSALSIIQMRYNEQMNTLHEANGYGVKPMFAQKYAIAYTGCLDDISIGEENPIVNVSVYQANSLVNIDLQYNEFLQLFRAVKDLYRPIEKKYQQYLAEFSTQPTVERLNQIIESGQF